MDKYEYKLKLEQLKNLVEKKDYITAADIADSINWRKVKSAATLCMVGEIYDRNKRYDDSYDILQMAYDRASVGRNILYRLTLVCLKMGNLDEAKEYYEEFLEVAPYDNQKYILRYQIAKLSGADLQEQVDILEEFKEREYTEEWAFELAYLYHRMRNSERCVEVCDELVLYFGDGKYVEKALELKMLYQPLNEVQEEKYRQFKQEGTEGASKDISESDQVLQEVMQIPDITANTSRFNTSNLQAEIAKSMQQILEADSKETVEDTMHNIKKIVEEIPYLQVPQEEMAEEETYDYIETDEEIDSSLRDDFREMLAEDWDGQYRMSIQGGDLHEPQVNGQMRIEDVLAEWERTKQVAETIMATAQQRRLESVKARALQETREFRERLNHIIPKLEAGISPQELLAERYLQNLPKQESLEEEYEDYPSEEMYASSDSYGEYSSEESYESRPEYEGYGVQEDYEDYPPERGYGPGPEYREYGSQEDYEDYPSEEGYGPGSEYGFQESYGDYLSEEEYPPSEGYGNHSSEERYEPQPEYGGYGVQEDYEDYPPEESYGPDPEYREYGSQESYGDYPSEEGYGPGSEYREYGSQESYGDYPSEEEYPPSEGYGNYSSEERYEPQPEYGGYGVQEDYEDYPPEESYGPDPEYGEYGSQEGYEDYPPEESYGPGPKYGEYGSQEIYGNYPSEEMYASSDSYGEYSSEERYEPQPKYGGYGVQEGYEDYLPEENYGPGPEYGFQEGYGNYPSEQGAYIFKEGYENYSSEERYVSQEKNEPYPSEEMYTSSEEERYVSQEENGNYPSERIGDYQPEEDYISQEKTGAYYPSEERETSQEGYQQYRSEEECDVQQVQPKENPEPEQSHVSQKVTEKHSQFSPETEKHSQFSPETEKYQPLEEVTDTQQALEQVSSWEEAAKILGETMPEEYLKTIQKKKAAEQGSSIEKSHQKSVEEREQDVSVSLEKLIEQQTEQQSAEHEESDAEQYLESVFRAAKASREEKVSVPKIKIEEPEEHIRRLSEEQKEIFSYFVPVTGMEQQLCQVLEGALHRKGKDNSSSSGNILITGGRGSGKTVLATDLIKAIKKSGRHPAGKVGKITGASLNEKELNQLIKKIAGGYLIIEKAGEISHETAIRLSLLMEQNTDGLLVIMEDTRAGIEKVLSQDVNFAKKFTERIKIPVFTSDELVEFAKAYAKEQECEIDDMGILALYNRISNIQKLDEATTLTEVKDIMDDAIRSADRGGFKKLFGRKKFSPEGYLYLREKDFED